MSRHGGDWAFKLRDRLPVKTGPKKPAGKMLADAKKVHDSLEEACAELALVKYRVTLHKADSGYRTGKHAPKVTPGMPDRIAVIPPTGRFAGFEIKTGADPKLKRSQPKVHAQLLADGAAAYVVTSLDQFDEMLRLLIAGERRKAAYLEAQHNHMKGGENHGKNR